MRTITPETKITSYKQLQDKNDKLLKDIRMLIHGTPDEKQRMIDKYPLRKPVPKVIKYEQGKIPPKKLAEMKAYHIKTGCSSAHLSEIYGYSPVRCSKIMEQALDEYQAKKK